MNKVLKQNEQKQVYEKPELVKYGVVGINTTIIKASWQAGGGDDRDDIC